MPGTNNAGAGWEALGATEPIGAVATATPLLKTDGGERVSVSFSLFSSLRASQERDF